MSGTIHTRRNRWLLAAMGVVALFFVGDFGYRRFVEEPAEEAARLQGQLSKRLRSAELELAKSKQIVQQLEELEQKSLPWEAEMARSRYRDWLLQLAQDAKLEGTSVDSGEPIAVTQTNRKARQTIELHKKFSFSFRGRGDLGQVTKFLYDFYRAGHLHKIRSMSLTPLGQGSQVDLNASIEAIALPNADRETELTTLVSEELALPDVRDYQLISRRDFFGRGGTHTVWRQITLSAVTSDVRGVGEAWFKVEGQSDTVMLQVGQSLSRPALDVLVVELDQAAAVVSVEGQRYRLAIGQTLAEAVPVRE